jgi:hypothetical protein
MNISNLTPHPLNIKNEQGEFITFGRTPHPTLEKRFCIVRAESQKVKDKTIAGITVVKTTFGEPVLCHVDERGQDPKPMSFKELPTEARFADFFVVSVLALQSCKGMFFGTTCVSPGEAIRNEEGAIIGANGFTI